MTGQRKISAFFTRKPAAQAAVANSAAGTSELPAEGQIVQEPAPKRRRIQHESSQQINAASSVELAALARRKLVDDFAQSAQASDSTKAQPVPRKTPTIKLTPLEQQVVRLKERHPGVLLLVEVRKCMHMHACPDTGTTA